MPTSPGGSAPDRRAGDAVERRRAATVGAIVAWVITLPESARSLLRSGRLVHCATTDPDGRPQISAIWVGLDGDEIVSASMRVNRKIRNLRRDPRIALSLDSDERNEIGMQYNLLIHGTAVVTEGGSAELLQRLVTVYAGPGVEFPLPPDPPPGYVIRISVDTVGGIGPWSAQPRLHSTDRESD